MMGAHHSAVKGAVFPWVAHWKLLQRQQVAQGLHSVRRRHEGQDIVRVSGDETVRLLSTKSYGAHQRRNGGVNMRRRPERVLAERLADIRYRRAHV